MLTDENVKTKSLILKHDALLAFDSAWEKMVAEYRQILDLEQSYQPLLYHCLVEHAQISLRQIDLNVHIPLDAKYQNNLTFDFVIYDNEIVTNPANGKSEESILLAILLKPLKEGDSLEKLNNDLHTLGLFEQGARASGHTMLEVLLIIDSVSLLSPREVIQIQSEAKELNIPFYYISREQDWRFDVNAPNIQSDIQWARTFYENQDVIAKMAEEAMKEIEAGLTEELDLEKLEREITHD
jgi:hypothetical protein